MAARNSSLSLYSVMYSPYSVLASVENTKRMNFSIRSFVVQFIASNSKNEGRGGRRRKLVSHIRVPSFVFSPDADVKPDPPVIEGR
ncbi:hypothetical protein RND71_030317 [Anisodus tanguticus]|uniref:Uncharacterized protein n=1 Tax=Anisodus tanguticus TaxID=243964 RepID=A0AAE1RH09_9SOLA|nr:hypothetical protein RND71_030317 [Anisodus tanguticus]